MVPRQADSGWHAPSSLTGIFPASSTSSTIKASTGTTATAIRQSVGHGYDMSSTAVIDGIACVSGGSSSAYSASSTSSSKKRHTTANNTNYVGRSCQVLSHPKGRGTGADDFSTPSTPNSHSSRQVGQVRAYLRTYLRIYHPSS